jgi:hypothetical protein
VDKDGAEIFAEFRRPRAEKKAVLKRVKIGFFVIAKCVIFFSFIQTKFVEEPVQQQQ